jgi:hypothetical protein
MYQLNTLPKDCLEIKNKFLQIPYRELCMIWGTHQSIPGFDTLQVHTH